MFKKKNKQEQFNVRLQVRFDGSVPYGIGMRLFAASSDDAVKNVPHMFYDILEDHKYIMACKDALLSSLDVNDIVYFRTADIDSIEIVDVSVV
jgi:hypothetical protein